MINELETSLQKSVALLPQNFDENIVLNSSIVFFAYILNGYFNTNIHFSYNAWIRFYISRPEEFTYSDISEVVETLKSYLNNFELEIQWQSPDEKKMNQPSIIRTAIMNPMTFVPDGLKSGCEISFKQI
jgi:hypothetical protein